MNVVLLAHTPMPERTVASAARLCYSPSSIEDIRDGMSDEKVASFVEMLAEIGHESPIEHATFTFGIEGVSRSLLAQITRHRIASYSVQSQRYVKEACFEYVTPPEIAAIPEAAAEYVQAMEEDQRHYPGWLLPWLGGDDNTNNNEPLPGDPGYVWPDHGVTTPSEPGTPPVPSEPSFP